MAVKPFSVEELNFFKFSSIVLDEFPKALRQTFISMWDSKIGSLPGYKVWDDTVAVRNMLLKSEGGKTDIPVTKSIQDWDSTALFKATIFAKTFVLPSSKKTLAEFYLKGRKPKPNPFHPTVNSPSGDQDETVTLAIDQLRLLRNALCHAAEPRFTKPDFDQYVQLAKDAFIATKVPTVSIDAIGCLSEADFPTAKVNELKDLQKELQTSSIFLQEKVIDNISDISERQEAFSDQLEILSVGIREGQETTHEELKKLRNELTLPIKREHEIDGVDKCDVSGIPSSLPASCLPAMVPHFTGRKEECQKIIASLMLESTRLFSIWGSPGFGKTSTAIAIGHDLKSQGQSVYFFTFRGISTKNEFISKLLSFFKRSTKSSLNANLAPADELCRVFEEIRSPFFVILDNLDDLFACTKANYGNATSVKDDVLRFIEEILARCVNVRFLMTTRESLEFMCLKMDGNESVRIGPLNQPSSDSLVRELLSSTTQDIRTQISQICGNVPLAIKLLCSLIKDYNETPKDCLEYIRQSSESLLDIIDDPSYLSDLRLKRLLEFSFDKLSLREREAFISLSVFAGVDFDLDSALAVIGRNKIHAKRSLRNLEKKSLIDFNVQSEMFSLHPLLQSFAMEKGENELKEVAISSRNRFYYHYIHLFGNLNEQFLTGKSMAAFVKFYQEEENIWLSLHEGFQDEELSNKLFDILAKAELFLDALYPPGWAKIDHLYDLACKKAKEQSNAVAFASLAVSKSFRVALYTNPDAALAVGCKETEAKIYSMLGETKAKYLCYQGIDALLKGRPDFGIQQVEKGLLDMNDNTEHKIWKVLVFQILAIYYNSSNNFERSKQFSKMAVEESRTIGDFGLLLATSLEGDEKQIERMVCESKTLLNQPLILWAISRLSVWVREYLCDQMKANLRIIVQAMQSQVEKSSPIWNKSLAKILQICDLALVYLCANDDPSTMEKIAVKDVERALETEKFVNQNREDESKPRKTDRQQLLEERLAEYHRSTGEYYDTKKQHRQALQSFQEELRVRMELNNGLHPETAKCYHSIGDEHFIMEEYSLALEAFHRALEIRIRLYGELHAETAQSYHNIGNAQYSMKDYTSALDSHHHALDIRLKLYGEQHADTAQSFYHIGIVQNDMEHYTLCLQSHRRALDIRLKLYGEQHADTAQSYCNIGNVQCKIKDYTSALKSHCRALDIRLKLYGKQHADTAQSYNNIGNVQNNMENYTLALRSHRRALDIRLKLYGEQHADTARSYNNIGHAQNNMKDYISALESYQRALDILLKVCGEQHANTAHLYNNIGNALYNMKGYTAALESFQRALDIRLKLYGEQHVDTAISYSNIGNAQYNLKDYTSALESHHRALDIRLKLCGEIHADTAHSYDNIGNVQYDMKNYISAMESYQHALEIRSILYGELHPYTAESYSNIWKCRI